MPFCPKCKGIHPPEYGGKVYCPVTMKQSMMYSMKTKVMKDFFGEAPSPFVGRYGYPNVNVGVLSTVDSKEGIIDSPRIWAQNNMQIPQILQLRGQLINSRFNVNIKQQNKLLDISKEIGMASKPVDIEVNLHKAPNYTLNTSTIMSPTGPSADLKKAAITSNPKISSKVERVFSDTDRLATDSLQYLFNKGFDENFLTKMFSVGTLGKTTNRKLVPTRFSITAVDDTIGKNIVNEIIDYPHSDPCCFYSGYLGNYLLIMFFPGPWSYELFEMVSPQKSLSFTTDYESNLGRTSYADNCAGGYYAARLPILELLKKQKRQASVLVFRFITKEYTTPMGVWALREATRKSLTKPQIHNQKESILKFAQNICKTFNINYDELIKHSKLIKQQSQLTLGSFLH